MYKYRQQGFTIVEILVVIVVIAILASISVVFYNGVQQRASNTATQLGLSNYAKLLTLHARLNNGVYPGAFAAHCLKDDKDNSSCLQVGSGAITCFGIGAWNRSTTFDNALATSGSLPSVSSQTMNCGGQPYRGGVANIYADGKGGDLIGLYKGNIACPGVSGLNVTNRQQQDDVTFCMYALPAL